MIKLLERFRRQQFAAKTLLIYTPEHIALKQVLAVIQKLDAGAERKRVYFVSNHGVSPGNAIEKLRQKRVDLRVQLTQRAQ